MLWKTLGVVLSLLIFATVLQYAINNDLLYLPSAKAEFKLYCCVYPYGYNNMTPLNETDFVLQLEKVKEIGFDGINLWNIECFYDESKVDFLMEKTKELGLDVLISLNYFNRSYSFPFPSQAYSSYRGFFDDAELELYCEFVTNVSHIVKNYSNFKGFLVYFPFGCNTQEEYDFWFSQISTSDYQLRYIRILEAIRKECGHPFYPSTMIWSDYPMDICQKLPKSFPYWYEGFAFQPYNIAIDDIEAWKIKNFYNYFKNYGKPHIAEFGYCTYGIYSHGKAQTEQRKAEMLIEFLEYMKKLRHDGFVCYFGLTDFPPENADFGLVYANYTLKPSGNAIKQWIQKNT